MRARIGLKPEEVNTYETSHCTRLPQSRGSVISALGSAVNVVEASVLGFTARRPQTTVCLSTANLGYIMTFSYLLSAFILLPIIELWLLFKVAAALDFGTALIIVVMTGVIGAWLARAQGLMVMLQIQRDLAEGRMPAPRMIDGMMILIAGALLITPGLITDAVGFLLLAPPVRVLIRGWLRQMLERKLKDGTNPVEQP